MSKSKMCLNSVMRRIAKKKLEANIISESQYCRTISIIKKIEKKSICFKRCKKYKS